MKRFFPLISVFALLLCLLPVPAKAADSYFFFPSDDPHVLVCDSVFPSGWYTIRFSDRDPGDNTASCIITPTPVYLYWFSNDELSADPVCLGSFSLADAPDLNFWFFISDLGSFCAISAFVGDDPAVNLNHVELIPYDAYNSFPTFLSLGEITDCFCSFPYSEGTYIPHLRMPNGSFLVGSPVEFTFVSNEVDGSSILSIPLDFGGAESPTRFDAIFSNDCYSFSFLSGDFGSAHVVDLSLASIFFVPVGSSSSIPVLSGIVDSGMVSGVLDQVVDLLPIVVGLIVGFIGLRKAISWLQGILHSA